jgi:hypothetical protein
MRPLKITLRTGLRFSDGFGETAALDAEIEDGFGFSRI